jgi:hypothetical protein
MSGLVWRLGSFDHSPLFGVGTENMWTLTSTSPPYEYDVSTISACFSPSQDHLQRHILHSDRHYNIKCSNHNLGMQTFPVSVDLLITDCDVLVFFFFKSVSGAMFVPWHNWCSYHHGCQFHCYQTLHHILTWCSCLLPV